MIEALYHSREHQKGVIYRVWRREFTKEETSEYIILIPRMSKKKVIWPAVFLAGSLLLNIFFLYQNYKRSLVTKVIDGDSFEVSDGRRIRLLGVDAPELENCMGALAKETLTGLISGRIVRLSDQVKDDYGRILSNVFSGGTFVNKEMVESGLGKYTLGKNKYHDEMRGVFNLARETNRGIFSDYCRRIEPESGCLIKANIRHGTKTYHLPGCRNYDQVIVDTAYADRWFCSEQEAAGAGFVKAEGC